MFINCTEVVEKYKWKSVPVQGVIKQAMTGSEVKRIGQVQDVEIKNGSKRITATLEIGQLSGDISMIIGLDLFSPLVYELLNVPILFPKEEIEVNKKKKPELDQVVDSEELKKCSISENGISLEWKKVLKDNINIPISSTCSLPESVVVIDTGPMELR